MMRFTITAKASSSPSPGSSTRPLSVTLKPAGKSVGAYEYSSDSAALLRMLRRDTEINGFELAAFTGDLRARSNAQLHRVPLKDGVLREVGFFID